MVDTYTDRLGLIEQEEGTHANEWGDLLNLNLARLDSATRGYIKIALSGAESLDSNDITTTASTAQEESFFKFIEFTGTGGTVTVPAENIMWIVYNNTGGDFTFQPSGGTGVTLTDGKVHFIVYGSNGTTFTDVTGLLASINAETITVADESADATCFPLFVTAATGDLAGKTGTNLTFDSSTGELGMTLVTATGDITGDTINATGDTSADDNAAMGYTAAEGLILTGQGSSNDVTIKNDADADVISIPTGTTDVIFAGDLTYGGIVYPKVKIIEIGDWNMGSTESVSVAHGLTYTNIRAISAIIRDDADAVYTDLGASCDSTLRGLRAEGTDVTLKRVTGGVFDNVDHNSTSYNRGWITITYV